MERKIGEAFTTFCGGESIVVTVVESKDGIRCKNCVFNQFLGCNKSIKEVGFCAANYRSDNKQVYFKRASMPVIRNRNVCVSYDKAVEWHNGDNDSLKEIALQAFSEEELNLYHFTNIKTFEDACKAIEVSSNIEGMFKEYHTFKKSRASIAAVKLNIVRQALNKGHKMSLAEESTIWYPFNIFIAEKSSYRNDIIEKRETEVVAKFSVGCKNYLLLNNEACCANYSGLSNFDFHYSVGFSDANVGFLGCATEEIAKHMGKYFAKEIFEAKYGDFIDFEWINC